MASQRVAYYLYAVLATAFTMDGCNRRWIVGAAFLCAVLIYVYPLTLSTPLLDPDEGIHAAISLRMAESGDYVTPRFLDKPFLDKPILYFLAQALSLRFLGSHEAAVRLPGLMFALLAALTTSLLARRLFDPATGWLSLLVALTSAIPASLAQAAAHDVALVPWTNLLLLCLWETDRALGWRRRAAFLGGVAVSVALAVLTKGLIGVAVVGAGYGLYVLALRRFDWAKLFSVGLSVAGGILLASPWFLAIEWQVPGYLHYYFVERHLQGFATNTQPHGKEPWYFYLPLILGGTVPWCVYLVPGLWQSWKDRGEADRASDNRATLFVCCWLIGGLGFLSLANSKLITYALPVYPAIAILVGHAWKRYLQGELSPAVHKVFVWLFLICCTVGCFTPAGILMGFDRINGVTSPAAAYLVAAIAAATTVAAMWLFFLGKRTASVAVGSQAFALLLVIVVTWPLQPLAEGLSQRQLARDIAQQPELPSRIVFGGCRAASLLFYLERDQHQQLHSDQVAEIDWDSAHALTRVPPGTMLVVHKDVWESWPKGPLQQSVSVRAAGGYCMVSPANEVNSIAEKPEAPRVREHR